MNDNFKDWMVDLGVVILAVALWGIVSFPFFGLGFNIGYKQGQIDALTGKIGYELVEQPDSTTKWIKIKEED